jgi:hypothetical protein
LPTGFAALLAFRSRAAGALLPTGKRDDRCFLDSSSRLRHVPTVEAFQEEEDLGGVVQVHALPLSLIS